MKYILGIIVIIIFALIIRDWWKQEWLPDIKDVEMEDD